MLKAKELRDKTVAELYEDLEELRNELLNDRLAFHARQLDNVSSMAVKRKSIARILTVIKEKEELSEGDE